MSPINKSRKQKKINNKFNKTKKNKNIYRGGKTKNDDDDKQKRQGVMDYMGDKMGNLASGSVSFLTNKTARLFGFKPINAAEEKKDQKDMNAMTKSVSDTASNLSNSVSNITSGITDSFNNGTSSMIGDMNDALDAPVVSDTVKQAADDTKEITEGLLENVNDTFDDPKFKKELGKTMENTAEIATITIKAMDKPIDQAIDKVNEAAGKALGGIAGTGIKVATDMMAAVPYVGAVVEMGKIINDTSKGCLLYTSPSPRD